MSDPLTYAERRAAVEWLASQSYDALRVRRAWAQQRSALVRGSGPRFDTVRMPALLVRRAAGARDRKSIQAALAEHGITTAVLADGWPRVYYALIPPGTREQCGQWGVPGVECLTPTCRVPLPAPSRTELPGAHWVLPAPAGPDALCDPGSLRQFLSASLGAPHEHC
ncbi:MULTISPECIES: hypothetical protein [Streptomyces]|uniref:hypothetical protein n=1 Tax=Streptomyces TaxID=1883 RepID=UPI00163BBFF6|nr:MULTISPECIES: hypothetical protein [Streptomyces]MBC2874047.1 hypothetical protein [Streptomyces sp. TYQ1024]UBI39018.1 hypothetical protein K7I03_22885 [Streptomyces mobaraensis]UKW31596.1 hypothetical protein MCU78_22830 [Streptomyces sp. TYQ1024]